MITASPDRGYIIVEGIIYMIVGDYRGYIIVLL